jgi:transcriptional regulator with XRE-family HTH domain
VTTTDPRTGAVLLRQLRESRGWSWSDLARALRDTARGLAVTSMTHRQVASIQRTIARWESLTDPTSPGDRYQFLLAHLYARTPCGDLALGPGSDFSTLMDALRHFGTPPQRVRQLVDLITQNSMNDGDELLALLSPA